MVTTNRKATTDTHTKKKKESKHNTKVSHQITREQKRKGRKKTYKNKYKTINKIRIRMAIRTYILIITLNINKLNDPNQRLRLAEWIHICCPQETHFRSRDTYRLKMRGWK